MRCPYCDKVMHSTPPPKRPKGTPRAEFRPIARAHYEDCATRDHIVPKSKGGRETILVCGACNADKMHLSLREYRAVLCVRRLSLVIFPFERRLIRTFAWSLLCTLARAL